MKGSIFRHPTPLPLGVSSGYVMTVLGPLPISEMGVTLMHEHILLDASGKWVPPCCCSDRHLAEMPVKMENLGELSLNPLMSRDNCQLFDVDVAIEELTKYRALGGETVVDPTNIGIGRDPKALARIARLTGLNIIMGTGLYLEPSHPEWVRTSSVERLTERLIYDLGGAEEKPEVLAGLIGEIGISSRFTPDEGSVSSSDSPRSIMSRSVKRVTTWVRVIGSSISLPSSISVIHVKSVLTFFIRISAAFGLGEVS